MLPESNRNGFEIAIIGMSARFPGANSVGQFWENLKNGVNSIRFFSDEELLKNSNFDPELLQAPNLIKAKGIIENIEYFDAHFFGYSPIEAELLDPQIRVFYEICWEALEDAGYDTSTYPGSIGVYAGGSANRFWEILAFISGKIEAVGQFASDSMIDKDYLASRISYKLNLRGPAISMHTACSTSLFGLDLACRSLLTGQCEAALVGGVSVIADTAKGGGYLYEDGLIRSRDGYVRSFDAGASGTIFSHGAGVIMVKRLDDALADGDHIYAVIKGFAANNDGLAKSSFSAPAIDGQNDVVRAALYMAEVDPQTISYIETHGTATEIGDPIEIEGLKLAFNSDKRQYCAIGSVKTNIGHLDVAAGIASIIKVVSMLMHRQIPPSLHFEKANPKIDFENSPFFVNTSLKEWKSDGHPLRAGVSSFGVGGTNAHIILEEPPLPEAGDSPASPYQLLTLSARTANALEQATGNLAQFLAQNPGLNLADVAFTLKVGRKTFEHKRMLVCTGLDEARQILESIDTGEPAGALPAQTRYEKEQKRAVFMFPGQGAQYVHMARGLYEGESVFRQEMDRCFAILQPLLGYDLKEIIYPASGPIQDQPSLPDIDQTEVTQSLIFTSEYALAQLLLSWGIRPYAMIGHSIGEYVAACLAGVFTLEDALAVVARRGQLMQKMPAGSMLSVPLAEKELNELLPAALDLAAVNGPSQCVVSGTHTDIEAFAHLLEEKGIQARKLHTSHAYHSKLMEPILESFAGKVGQVGRHEPVIPFISNVTGKWMTVADALDPQYWARHLRSTVRFADGVGELVKERQAIFIEVGPGRTLSTLVRQHPDKQPEHAFIHLVRHPHEEVDDRYFLLNRLGELWLYGTPVDWTKFYRGERRKRLSLPTYPFQRQPYWIEGNPGQIIREGLGKQGPSVKKPDISDWFYAPSWKPSVIARPGQKEAPSGSPHQWLILAGQDNGFSQHLLENLLADCRENGAGATIVTSGEKFGLVEENTYTIDPYQAEGYQNLIQELHQSGKFPERIVFLWNLSSEKNATLMGPDLEKTLVQGFYSLIYLAQAIGRHDIQEEIHITILTNGMQQVWGEAVTHPDQAVVLGPVSVIPLEYPEIKCRCIDIEIPGETDDMQAGWLTGQLIRELKTGIHDSEPLIAYRGRSRLARSFAPVPIGPGPIGPIPTRLRESGVYLISGGLGGIGLVLAEHLARTVRARLVLAGRSPFPDPAGWENWLNTHNSLDKTSRTIRKLTELITLGAEVTVFSLDIGDLPAVQTMVDQVKNRYGNIDGVIHAAGLPGGGVIQLKTRDIADKVLRPKIQGTYALDQALQGTKPDFIVLCSSLNAVVAYVGQVDYMAANAFMDAFAFYKNSLPGHVPQVVSIDWDGWQEVGMAVEAARKNSGQSSAGVSEPKPVDHPLFDHYLTRLLPGNKIEYVFTTYFSPQRHWVVRDHHPRGGIGLVPGVTYLEMAHAAFIRHLGKQEGDQPVEIRDVSFVTPLLFEDDRERETRMTLQQKNDGSGFQFIVKSRVKTGQNRWITHARGEVGPAIPSSATAIRHDLKAIEARCNRAEIDGAKQWMSNAERSLLIYGPRWQNLKTFKVGDKEVLTLHELPLEFHDELGQFTIFPSMLDLAAAALSGSFHTEKAYIPYSYGKVRVNRAFPARLYAYSRVSANKPASLDFLRFDITIMDETGEEVADIEEFTMLEISGEILGRLKSKKQGEPGEEEIGENEGRHALVVNGIAPQEGIEAFDRILSETLPQVVVSTRDIKARIEEGRARTRAAVNGPEEKTQAGPRHSRPDIGAPYVQPVTDLEKQLAQIWGNLLGLDQVGIQDDFFELGGDSLKAASLIARIKKELNVDMSVRDIFNSPRVKDLAGRLGNRGGSPQERMPAYTGLKPAEKRRYYPLTALQRKLFILDRMGGIGTAYNLPFASLVQGELDLDKLKQVIKILIGRHESFRTSFTMIGEEPVQIVHAPETLETVIEYWETPGEKSGIDSQVQAFIRPFNLGCAPLLRLGIGKLSPGRYLMIFDIHHIISDASSYMIMIREFNTLYEDIGRSLPALSIQYRDYVLWQESGPGRDLIEKQAPFWLNRFEKGKIPLLEMNTDFPRPPIQEFAGQSLPFIFDQTLTGKIHRLLKNTSTTLFMVILAIYNVVLSRYSGQEDIVVGSPVAGRNRVEIENMTGLFINALALRNSPLAGLTFNEFLLQVKENTLQAFENQDYPFAELIDKVGLSRVIDRNPLYDAELIVQNMTLVSLKMGGLEISSYWSEKKTAQLDISLEAVELENKVKFSLTYASSLFRRETMEKFIASFLHATGTVVDNPGIKLAAIRLAHELATAEATAPLPEEIKFAF